MKPGNVAMEETTAAVTPTTPQAMPTIAIPEDIRNTLASIIQDLLLKTHELSFEYSTCDCMEIQNCPLAQKSKELFRTVKQLNQLMKKVSPPAQPTYVR